MTTNSELVTVENKQSVNWDEILQNENVVSPVVDIIESNDAYMILAQLPGAKKSDVSIKIENQSLKIMAKMPVKQFEEKKFILNESVIGHYYRTFKLSDSINIDDIEARLEDGILALHLPKSEKAKPKTIEIK